jgi:hypothetical protein
LKISSRDLFGGVSLLRRHLALLPERRQSRRSMENKLVEPELGVGRDKIVKREAAVIGLVAVATLMVAAPSGSLS